MYTDIRTIMRVHAVLCVLFGLATLLLPHALLGSQGAVYDHLAHEYIRLYGCLSLAVGWIVLSVSDITDGRILRRVSEAFSAGYLAQGVVMARAQFTNPGGHSLTHWSVAIASIFIGCMYIFIRVIKKLKDFDLPRNF
jgi:hypothetical protein